MRTDPLDAQIISLLAGAGRVLIVSHIRPDGDAILDRDHVKGHFEDYGEPVMRLYAERVAQLEL